MVDGVLRRASMLLLAAAYVGLLFYWYPFSLFGVSVDTQLLSLVALVAIIAINLPRSVIFSLVAFRPTILMAGLYLLAFALAYAFAQHPDSDPVILVRIGYTVVFLILHGWAVGYLQSASPKAVYQAALAAIVVFVSLLAWGGAKFNMSLLQIFLDIARLDFRGAGTDWRVLFTLGEYRVGDDGGNFRNGLAATLFCVTVIGAQTRSRLGVSIVLLGCLTTLSLLSLSGIVLVLGFVLFRFLGFRLRLGRIALYLVLIAAIAVPAGFFASRSISDDQSYQLQRYIEMRVYGSVESRLEGYQLAWEDIQRSPVRGYYPGYKITPASGIAQYPHNNFLAIWLNAGLFGLVVYSLLYIALVARSATYTGLATFDREGHLQVAKLAGIALGAAVLRAMVGSSFEQLFDYGSALGVGYYLAVTQAARHARRHERPSVRRQAAGGPADVRFGLSTQPSSGS